MLSSYLNSVQVSTAVTAHRRGHGQHTSLPDTLLSQPGHMAPRRRTQPATSPSWAKQFRSTILAREGREQPDAGAHQRAGRDTERHGDAVPTDAPGPSGGCPDTGKHLQWSSSSSSSSAMEQLLLGTPWTASTPLQHLIPLICSERKPNHSTPRAGDEFRWQHHVFALCS